jgi:hypothetical protein
MRQLIVKQLDYDLTPVAGLALVGQYLKAVQPVLGRLDAALPVKGGVANSDIVRSYLGLLVQGKSDFDAIENFRGDTFYKQALGIGLLPSSPTLRQRYVFTGYRTSSVGRRRAGPPSSLKYSLQVTDLIAILHWCKSSRRVCCQ